MLFNSLDFLLFFPAVCLISLALRSLCVRKAVSACGELLVLHELARPSGSRTFSRRRNRRPRPLPLAVRPRHGDLRHRHPRGAHFDPAADKNDIIQDMEFNAETIQEPIETHESVLFNSSPVL